MSCYLNLIIKIIKKVYLNLLLKPSLSGIISFSQKGPDLDPMQVMQCPEDWLHVLFWQYSLQDVLQKGPYRVEAHSEISKKGKQDKHLTFK